MKLFVQLLCLNIILISPVCFAHGSANSTSQITSYNQLLAQEWAKYNELEKLTNDIWEKNSLKLQLTSHGVSPKKKIQQIDDVYIEIIQQFNEFKPKTTEIQKLMQLRVSMLSIFRKNLIDNLIDNSTDPQHHEKIKQNIVKIRSYLYESSQIEKSIEKKLQPSL